VGHFHLEENLQHTLVAVVEERKLAKAAKNGQMTKVTLQNIVRPSLLDNN
jgi:hypothetical protein